MLLAEVLSPEWSVLLAVAEPECSRLLSILLDGFGYSPLECSDAQAGHQHLVRLTPVLAVVDELLPGAHDLCREIRDRKDIPLLVLVRSEDPETEARCKQMGADSWEPLTAEPEALLAALRRLAHRASV